MSQTAWNTDLPEEELRQTLVDSERVKARKQVRDARRQLEGAVARHRTETDDALARMVELDGPIATDPLGWIVTGWKWATYAPSIHADPQCGYLNFSTIEPVLARDAVARGSVGCNSCGRAFRLLKKMMMAERKDAAARQAGKAAAKVAGKAS